MKAERRHELQTNALAQWMAQAPEFFRRHGSKFLTLLIVVLALVVVLRYMRAKTRQSEANAEVNLAQAERNLQLLLSQPRPAMVGGTTLDDVSASLKSIQEVLGSVKNPALLARASVALGDYYWAAANYPDRPRSTVEEDLSNAQRAYERVAKEYADHPVWAARAELALAKVAENRAKMADDKAREAKQPLKDNPHWEEARRHYEAVSGRAGVPKVLQEEAQRGLRELPEISKPIPIAATRPAASTGPATNAVMGPIAPPVPPTTRATAPATRPR